MGKGGMGMVGANLSEAVGKKKHFNPKWEGMEKPPPPTSEVGPHVADHIRKKHAERANGSVDWASRFAEDARFGGAKVQWQAEQQHHHVACAGVGTLGGVELGLGMGTGSMGMEMRAAMGMGQMGMGAPPPPPPPPPAAPSDEVPDFAALVEKARKIAELAQKQQQQPATTTAATATATTATATATAAAAAATLAMDPAEARAKLLAADARWGAGVAPDGERYFFEKTTGSTRWDAPEELRPLESTMPLVLGEPLLHPALPSAWRELRDTAGRPYYWNASEGVTQWTRPIPPNILVGTILPVKRREEEEEKEKRQEEEEQEPNSLAAEVGKG